MLKLFLGSLLVGAVAIATDRPEAPTPAVEITAATTTTTTTTIPEMTTTTTKPPNAIPVTTTTTTDKPSYTEVQRKAQTVSMAEFRYPQWISLASEIGWPESELDRLDYVIHRESRGLPDVHNMKDPMGGSRGLTQINGFWCRKNSNEPHRAGFLGAHAVLDSCEELFDPETNLRAALTIWRYGVQKYRCGWGPWQTKGFRPCR
jgi:hypothetical protein